MFMTINGLLNTAELERIRSVLTKTTFVDGRTTAGEAVRHVKNNLQVTEKSAELDECRALVLNALMQNEAFKAFALPKRILAPMFNRYDAGMDYGSHVDNAVMGGAEAVRADISLTVFLNEASDYDGGGLVIHSDLNAQAVRLPAGSAIVYASSTVHRVEPVTRGSRFAAVTWVQSMIRDEARRELILELGETARWARKVAPGSPEAMRVTKIRTNLMRMWADV